MPTEIHAVRSIPKTRRALVTLVTTDTVEDGIAEVAELQLVASGFEGKRGQIHRWPDSGRVRALVGVGSAGDLTADEIRTAGGVIARQLARVARVGVELPAEASVEPVAARQALAEGLVLGGYSFSAYKSRSGTKARSRSARELVRVDVAGSAAARAQAALDRGAAIAGGQVLARDLVNEPGGSLTPPVFARRAATIARKSGLRVKVWTEAEIKKAKLGGLLGVSRGSTQPPRLVEITHQPRGKATGTLALVGKGLTFDAGGLSIKTSQGMMTMKGDMGGAAAVIGAMAVIPSVAPNLRVRAFLPMTDNMLGGDATRPGDVLTIRNGKTIEVLNTDAEGRLVLADALSLASEAKPDAMVDIATLTGACMVALGPKIAGLMGNHDGWIEQVRAAGEASGEQVWPLPLPKSYRSQIDSVVADMKNIGGNHGGALTAGLLLSEFVAEGIPWAHLDIAGPAFTDSEDPETRKGGTGFGVRLLVELARGFSRPENA
ncbi:MAG: leucyl aminopeptidase [Acidimicrobiales bacterium]